MTYAELAERISNLSVRDQNQEAKVYPPLACPATQMVPVLGLEHDTSGRLVISTGKSPAT